MNHPQNQLMKRTDKPSADNNRRLTSARLSARWFSGAAVLLLVGCSTTAEEPQTTEQANEELRRMAEEFRNAPRPTTRASRTDDLSMSPELARMQQQRPVAAGTLPMAYQLRGTGDYRLVETTGGQTVATFFGDAGDFLLAESDGLRLGGRLVTVDELDPAGAYALYHDTSAGASVITTTTTEPTAPPADDADEPARSPTPLPPADAPSDRDASPPPATDDADAPAFGELRVEEVPKARQNGE